LFTVHARLFRCAKILRARASDDAASFFCYCYAAAGYFAVAADAMMQLYAYLPAALRADILIRHAAAANMPSR